MKQWPPRTNWSAQRVVFGAAPQRSAAARTVPLHFLQHYNFSQSALLTVLLLATNPPSLDPQHGRSLLYISSPVLPCCLSLSLESNPLVPPGTSPWPLLVACVILHIRRYMKRKKNSGCLR